MSWTFDAEVFPWDEEGPSWRFGRLPDEVADDIRAQAAPSRSGTVRVVATIGTTSWNTSLFPVKDPPGFLLAVKAAVRRSEHVEDGDVAAIALALAN
jgi:hypothetical protein